MRLKILELGKDEYGFFVPPKMRKGMTLVFKDRKVRIMKAQNDTSNGFIIGEDKSYSTDFIHRQIKFGFVQVAIIRRKPQHMGTGIHVHQQFQPNQLIKGDTFFDADYGDMVWTGKSWKQQISHHKSTEKCTKN